MGHFCLPWVDLLPRQFLTGSGYPGRSPGNLLKQGQCHPDHAHQDRRSPEPRPPKATLAGLALARTPLLGNEAHHNHARREQCATNDALRKHARPEPTPLQNPRPSGTVPVRNRAPEPRPSGHAPRKPTPLREPRSSGTHAPPGTVPAGNRAPETTPLRNTLLGNPRRLEGHGSGGVRFPEERRRGPFGPTPSGTPLLRTHPLPAPHPLRPLRPPPAPPSDPSPPAPPSEPHGPRTTILREHSPAGSSQPAASSQSSGASCLGSLQLLSQDVQVAGVAGGLLDQVDVDPPDRDRAHSLVRHLIVE
jgi:hypothetical protein